MKQNIIYDNEEEESTPDEMRSVVFTVASIFGLIVALVVIVVILIF